MRNPARSLSRRSINRSIERIPGGRTRYPKEAPRGGYTFKNDRSVEVRIPSDVCALKFGLSGDFSVSPPVINAVACTYESGRINEPVFDGKLGDLATRQLIRTAYYLSMAQKTVSLQN